MAVLFIPLGPHFYIVILRFIGVYIFLIFALKHRSWVLDKTARSMRCAKKENITIFHLKITIFTAVKNHNILHRHVIVTKTKILPWKPKLNSTKTTKRPHGKPS